MRRQLNPFLRKLGYEISKYSPSSNVLSRRIKLVQAHQIDLVLDIGANVGQFARGMRSLGYMGEIISFEPLSAAYAELQHKASADAKWRPVKLALGDFDGEAEINVSADSQSSSLLDILPSHTDRSITAAYVGKENITVRKLDSIFDEYVFSERNIYLKIDAQGFEQKIIEGASQSLPKIAAVQLEASIIPLYSGECLLPDMIKLMEGMGFTLMSLEPGHCDAETGQLYQVDCVFFR
jgi:FkbM family methyltransferase